MVCIVKNGFVHAFLEDGCKIQGTEVGWRPQLLGGRRSSSAPPKVEGGRTLSCVVRLRCKDYGMNPRERWPSCMQRAGAGGPSASRSVAC